MSATTGKAVVKCVLSGDTIVIWGRPVNGPPAEKVLALAYVAAPHFGRRGSTEDEPFAFESREHLRKLVVGKEVMFKGEYSTQSGREFFTVHLSNDVAESLNKKVVKAGWAKYRPAQKPTDDAEALAALETEAQSAGLGVWTTNAADLSEAQPNVKFTLADDPRKFLDAHKGSPITGIVEQVRDGSTLRVLLLPMFQNVTVMLTGIKAPTVRKDIPDADVVEPFGEEAKYFTESRLLQREVKVLLEGVSNQNGFFATIMHPAGNISEALVAAGLAKVVDWSITMVTGGPAKLRSAEQSAKQKQLRLWKNYSAKNTTDGVVEKKFDGVVTRIVGADSLMVQSASSGQEYKITLSSYRQPKPKDASEAYYNFEAKEFLRSKCIGKSVTVTVEYTRPPTEGFDEQRMCGTVMLGQINLAEALLNKGLGGVFRHRKDDEDRSHHFDSLLAAEEKAQKAKRGMHSDVAPPPLRIVDISETAVKARSFLSSFSRMGRIPAVVEFVSSGSRFRLYVPKENGKMTLVLAGIRCPRSPRPPTDKGDQFGQEALDFVSKKCLQRDVLIEVENIDKSGSFIGSLFVDGRENVAVSLLEQGLATIHGYSADQSQHTNALYAAENIAKSKRSNIWSVARDTAEPETQEITQVGKEVVEVTVTEVVDGHHLFLQVLSPSISALEQLMSELSVQMKTPCAVSYAPKNGELVCARYALDGAWYRAKVRKLLPGKRAEIFYVDYGNTEQVNVADIRPLDPKFSKLGPVAQEAFVSFVRVPDVDADDYGLEAAQFLKDLVNVPKLKANIDYRKGNVLCVTLQRPDSALSVTEELLQAGWAQVHNPGGTVQYDWQRLEKLESMARQRRLGMFEYGDYSLDNDDPNL